MNPRISGATYSLALLLFASCSASALQYAMRVLPLPEGYTYGGACDINDQGQIVGYYAVDASGNNHPEACIWDSAGFHDLGFQLNSGRDAKINNYGDVVGASRLFRDGQLTSVPIPPNPPCAYRLMNTNNQRYVVGGITTDLVTLHMRASYWDDAGMHDLGTQSGYVSSLAYDANEQGQIVGTSEDSTWPQPLSGGFIWENGTMTPLGALPGYNQTQALSVNNLGQVVGSSYNLDYYWSGVYERAFIWQNGVMTDLLGLTDRNTRAIEITDSGLILGYAWTRGGPEQGFVWKNGTLTWLEPVYHECAVHGINEEGLVVGERSGEAVVWELVPEPASLIVLAFGTALAMRRLCTTPGHPC